MGFPLRFPPSQAHRILPAVKGIDVETMCEVVDFFRKLAMIFLSVVSLFKDLSNVDRHKFFLNASGGIQPGMAAARKQVHVFLFNILGFIFKRNTFNSNRETVVSFSTLHSLFEPDNLVFLSGNKLPFEIEIMLYT